MNKQSLNLFTLFIIFTLFSTTLFAQPSVDETKAKLITAWEKQKTISADISADATLPVNNVNLKLKGIGELWVQREGDKEKYMQKISAFPATLVESGDTSLLNNPFAQAHVFFDGTDYYVTYKLLTNQETFKTPPDITKGSIPPGGKNLFDVIKDKVDITVKPETEYDGKKMITLQLTPKQGQTGDFQGAYVLMDPDIGIMRKLEILGKDLTPMFTCEFKNVKTDVKIPDGTFVVPSPPTENTSTPNQTEPKK
ncbi:MAG TPA: hypothetical protein PLT82_09235 [Candidatus Hydrogenedens sp.]|nr:hypothetical protein [Candidatus Hydrogenedens sp.]HOK09598.1 hypothetical protein [Candidatus Hydrogenedens sp.]HOL18834.1 hypothetical protein [Candidatus Hydrogenedens sp.]HPP59302.1 hypothetical protein [Candidatus Hydrogenedens sp.]